MDVFILSDDADVRSDLSIALTGAGYEGVCFSDETALLKAMRRRCPACIIIELGTRGQSALGILKDLSDCPAPVFMISGCADIATAVDAIKGGAADFMTKPFAHAEFLKRLKTVLESGSRVTDKVLCQKLPPIIFSGREPLSHREMEVLEHTLSGLSSKETAIALEISPRTAEDHRANILRKLGFKSIRELILAAIRA